MKVVINRTFCLFLGGGVIDLMNRRLQQRLTEPEILKIFSNVCEVSNGSVCSHEHIVGH